MFSSVVNTFHPVFTLVADTFYSVYVGGKLGDEASFTVILTTPRMLDFRVCKWFVSGLFEVWKGLRNQRSQVRVLSGVPFVVQ